MKKFIILLTLTFSMTVFSGCSWLQPRDRIILNPSTQQYPLFAIEEFKKSPKCEVDMWEERDNKGEYLVGDKNATKKCIKENKETRSKYNLLVKKVTDFNIKLKDLNKIQTEKKPYEVK